MADELVDCMGLICPRPLFETIKRLKRMQAGQTLEVFGDYPLSLPEITENMEKQGQELVSVTNEGGVWRIVIKKLK
ncbi:putative sulfur carrier protein [anaerobic digester metagenome]|jgi:TusA-related sulfurtransferase|nr:sulfurtransferase TusA family protein [Methanomassiliicoccales archaeon]